MPIILLGCVVRPLRFFHPLYKYGGTQLLKFCGTSVSLLLGFCGTSLALLLGFCGTSVAVLLQFCWAALALLLDFCGISVAVLLHFRGTTVAIQGSVAQGFKGCEALLPSPLEIQQLETHVAKHFCQAFSPSVLETQTTRGKFCQTLLPTILAKHFCRAKPSYVGLTLEAQIYLCICAFTY